MSIEQVAVFDLGSARTKLFVAVKGVSGKLSYSKFSEETGLGSLKIGEKDDAVIREFQEKLKAAIDKLYTNIDPSKETKVITVATEAIRNNIELRKVLDQMSDKLGKINLLSPEKEADIFYQGMRSKLGEEVLLNSVLVDIGGGSIQVIWNRDGKVNAKSFPLGTYRLEKDFEISGIPLTEAMIEKISNHITKTIENEIPIGLNIKNVIMGSNCMHDFMSSALSKAGMKMPESGNVRIEDVQSLFDDMKGRDYDSLADYYPKNPKILYGMDKSLLITILIAAYFGSSFVIPTDESLSTAMVGLAFNEDAKVA